MSSVGLYKWVFCTSQMEWIGQDHTSSPRSTLREVFPYDR